MTDPCPKRPGGGGHCWHGTRTATLTVPPQYPERCCWCGAERIRHDLVWRDERPHGPFRPAAR